jgi:hypothetical protein
VWVSGGIAPPFLTSALDRGERSASRPGRFTTVEIAPGTHWAGGWVGPRIGLDVTKKIKMLHLLGIEPQLSRPQLYRLSYPGSKECYGHREIKMTAELNEYAGGL